jgi:hypothetical protein
MSVRGAKSIVILSAALAVLSGGGCAKPTGYAIGSSVRKVHYRLHLPQKGTPVLLAAPRSPETAKATQCSDLLEKRKVVLRSEGKEIPWKAECDRQTKIAVYRAPTVLDAGSYDYLVKGLGPRQKGTHDLTYYEEYAEPDYASGGDQVPELAAGLAFAEAVKDELKPRDGDATDWYVFEAAGGYVWIRSEADQNKLGAAGTVTLVRLTSPDAEEEFSPLKQFPLGTRGLVPLRVSQAKYGLKVEGDPRYAAIRYELRVDYFPTDPHAQIEVADLYRNVGGEVVAVLALPAGDELAPAAQLSVFRRAGKSAVYFGSCRVSGVTGRLGYCSIGSPPADIPEGKYFAKRSPGDSRREDVP